MDAQKIQDEQGLEHSDWWKEIATCVIAVAVMFALFGRDAMLKLYGLQRHADAAAQSVPAEKGADTKHAKVFIKTVQVQPTKADGRKWDAYPYELPDIKVRIRNRTSGQVFQTPVKQDCLKATFNTPAIYVSEGDDVEITVWDNDLQFDDLIGRYSTKITAEMLKAQDLDLSFGQVLSLQIQLQPHVRVSKGRGMYMLASAQK